MKVNFPLKARRCLAIVSLLAAAGSMEVKGQGTTQLWTGIVPPPENGTAYSLSDIQGGIWDDTANWADAAAGVVTNYHSLTTGAGRVASFQPKTGGYTVTIADDYSVPVIRALQASGGNNSWVMIQANVDKTIRLSVQSGAYLSVGANKELIIGENVAIDLFGVGTYALSKVGDGTLRWSGPVATAFTHTLQINAGRFIIDADASSRFNSSSTVVVNGGEFRYNGAAALEATVTLNSGRISGEGRIASAVTVGANATVAPGDGKVGAQKYDSLTFASGGTYQWEIGSWNGTSAGIDFDQLQATAFSVTATDESRFVISIATYGGALPDFDGSQNRSWTILDSEETIPAGVLEKLALDDTAFRAVHAFDGDFSLEIRDGDLTLVYTTIPEPRLVLWAGAALAAFATRRRGNR